MNCPPRFRRAARGFTLIELLVVISIIIILAAISFAAVGYANQQGNRKKAEAQFQLLATGLDLYRVEAGTYPVHTSAPEEGSKVVYQALTGNGDDLLGGNSAPTNNPRATDLKRDPYVPELLPNSGDKQGWITNSRPFEIIDPWAQPWNYLSGDPNAQDNAGYDLWSTANKGEPAKWIGNRKS